MKGLTIKEILRKNGITQADIAKKIGESPQNLSAALSQEDVRTGLVEKIAEAIGLPVSAFYGDTNIVTASGDNASAVAGNNNHVNMKPDKFLGELAAQRQLTEAALTQNSELIGIIKQLTSTK